MSIQVKEQQVVAAAADEVWALLSDFGDMSWAGFTDVLVEGEGPGSIRKVLVAPDGSRAVERLDALDARQRSFRYAVLEGLPLPARDLVGTVVVKEAGADQCTVEWHATAVPVDIEPEALEQMLSGLYRQVLDNLAKHFGK